MKTFLNNLKVLTIVLFSTSFYGCPAAVLIPAVATGVGTYAVGDYAAGLADADIKGNGEVVYSASREVLVDEFGFTIKSENKDKRTIEAEGSGRMVKVTVEELTPKLSKVRLAAHKGIGGEAELNTRIAAAIQQKVEGGNQTIPHLKE
jgi:hypothetical protein